MVTKLVIANVVVYILNELSQQALLSTFHLQASTILQPWKWYQFLTYGFLHAPMGTPNGVQHLLFNMLGLWMLGRYVEDRYGQKEFLLFYLAAIIFSGFVWAFVETMVPMLFPTEEARVIATCVGASGGVVATVMLFIVNFPRVTLLLMFVIPMPAWVLGVLLIVMDLYTTIAVQDSNVAASAHLAGAAFAFIYFKLHWNFSVLTAGISSRWKSRNRPKLKIHDPDTKKAKLDDQADAVLDKLHREGEESLNRRERKILEEYSRRVRDRRQ